MTATTRSASKDLVIASQRLMDGLLDVEESAFRVLDAGVQQVADATRENIVAAERLSPAKLDRADLVPDDRWLAAVLLPPVAQLIAAARERALAVAKRQMQLLSAQVGPHAAGAALGGEQSALRAADEVERLTYRQATDGLLAAVVPVRGDVVEQRRLWKSRHEPREALIARCCTQDRVGLPGATRGVVWALRPRMHSIARAASVDTCNALLMASMRGWNTHATDTP